MFDILRKKKGVTLKLCPLRKNHGENVHQKLPPKPFLILLNNPKQLLDERNSFKNENYQKALKKLTLSFLLNPVSFNGQSYR